MKRRLLIFGTTLLLLGFVLAAAAPDVLNQFGDLVGFPSRSRRLVTIIEPTLVPVSASNRGYVAASLARGGMITGNFTVLSGGTASIIGLDEAGFKKWTSDETAPLLFFTMPSRNGTFSFRTEQGGTYYFVVIGSENSREEVIMTVNLVEEVRQATPLLSFGGLTIIASGAIFTGLGTWNELRVWRSQRRDRLVSVAESLGISVVGKSVEDLRREIRRSLDTEPGKKS